MDNKYREGYPRPQFVRENYLSLSGTWNFAFDDEDRGIQEKWQKKLPGELTIQVPFSYETKLSGIGDEKYHPVVWYEKNFPNQLTSGKRLILHFEGSDFRTFLYVNGELIGHHIGGYTRFSFDITEALVPGENRITLRIEDSMETCQPRGKQRWKKENFTCFYVQTTGLWKSVWMEEVSPAHLLSVKVTPDAKERKVALEARIESPDFNNLELETCILLDGKEIRKERTKVSGEKVSLMLEARDQENNISLWSPENPVLYDLDFCLYENGKAVDKVYSYFGFRTIEIQGNQILLNGKKLYLTMILDQGYWPESGLTPPSEQAILQDIEKTKAFGFNGARKHQKVEDERFYYYADVMGLLVWHEFPATFNFTMDACLNIEREWMRAVKQHYNHPSIITWVPFNESWGLEEIKEDKEQQEFTLKIKEMTRQYDSLRPIILNDGWEHTASDIITLHDYESKIERMADRYKDGLKEILENKISANNYKMPFADGFSYRGQPVLISEYGGIAISGSKGWGYNDKVSDKEACLKLMKDITDTIRQMENVSGFCYTQLTDVQQEVNGLQDENHVDKFDPDRVKEIMDYRLS